MMEVKLLSKVVNSAKAVAKDYKEYYKTANSAANKFKKNHPVANVFGGIALGLAIVYITNPNECNELINTAKDSIKKFKDEHKKNTSKLHEGIDAVDVHEYEDMINSITSIDELATELTNLETIRKSKKTTMNTSLMLAIGLKKTIVEKRITEILCEREIER